MSNQAKVVVIGFDGATWNLIEPWANKGMLPTFKKLLETGTHGDLESTIPPITGPAWVSFATGKNPGKHGCYDFVIPRGSLNNLRPITTKDIKGETFYEILDINDKKCILINLPASWPPRIPTPVITSILTQSDKFIFPEDLVEEIPELRSYRIVPNASFLLKGKIEEYIDDIRKVERTRFECAKRLFKIEWDFFFLLFSGMDWAQHEMYEKLIRGEIKEDTEVAKLYKELDEYLGWFLDNIPPATTLLLMSDHGFRTFESSFYINEWLRQKGFLAVEREVKPCIPRHKGREEMQRAQSSRIKVRIPFLSKTTEIPGWLRSIYRRLAKILPISVQLSGLQPRMLDTIACATLSVPIRFMDIYINDKRRFTDGKVEPNEYEGIRAEIMSYLAELRNPTNGQKVLKNVWRKEDIYHGSELDMAPDLILMSDSHRISRAIRGKAFEYQTCSNHALNGIFLAYGPAIKKWTLIEGAKIYDIAPTILYMFGLPIPNDMDGRVLKEIFKEGSEVAQREVRHQQVDVEQRRVKSKISDLKRSNKI